MLVRHGPDGLVSSRAANRSDRGLPGAQVDLGALERASTTVAGYQPHMIPGLAQTAGYARSWLAQPSRPTTLDAMDIDGVVAARLARQGILNGPQRVTIASAPPPWSAYTARSGCSDSSSATCR